MKIILSTSSTNPHYNGDCDYAVVDLTAELVAEIRQRVELVREMDQRDGDLYELYFWGGTATFYDYSLVEAGEKAIAPVEGTDADQAACDWLADLEHNGHALLPAGVDLAAQEPQRTECNQFIVRRSPPAQNPEFEIAWLTIPKHSDVYVTTHDLSLAALEGYLRQHEEALT